MNRVNRRLILVIVISTMLVAFFGCTKEGGAPVSQEVTSEMDYEAQQIRILQQRIQQSEQILKTDPKNLAALIDLGNSYYDLGNNQKAIDFYSQALEIDPSNSNVRTDMGTAYKRIGELDRALEEYQKSLDADPKHSTTYYNRGVVYYAKGSINEAVESWEKYLELAPNGRMSMAARDNLERVKKLAQ